MNRFLSHTASLSPVPCQELDQDQYRADIRTTLFKSPVLPARKNAGPALKRLQDLHINEKEYAHACCDHYFRTLPNPEYASFALVFNNQAHFYRPPLVASSQLSYIKKNKSNNTSFTVNLQIPLYQEIKEIYYQKPLADCLPSYIGYSADGRTLYGTERLKIQLGFNQCAAVVPASLVCFYPENSARSLLQKDHRPSSDRIFNTDKKHYVTHYLKTLYEEFILRPWKIKAVKELDVDLPSLADRKKIVRREPSQNKVMGHSAVEEITQFLQSPLASLLQEQTYSLLEQSSKAPHHGPGLFSEKQRRAEWLHLIGFGCTPMSMNPQIRENLVSAPKSLNTEQMISEYIIQTLGKAAYEQGYTNNDFKIKIVDSFFEMIPTTQIASYMSYNTRLEMARTGRSIDIKQQSYALQEPQLRYKADVGAGCVLFSGFLNAQQPSSILKIKR